MTKPGSYEDNDRLRVEMTKLCAKSFEQTKEIAHLRALKAKSDERLEETHSFEYAAVAGGARIAELEGERARAWQDGFRAGSVASYSQCCCAPGEDETEDWCSCWPNPYRTPKVRR